MMTKKQIKHATLTELLIARDQINNDLEQIKRPGYIERRTSEILGADYSKRLIADIAPDLDRLLAAI